MKLDWRGLLTNLTATMTIVAVIGYIGRSAISQFLVRDMERYRSELNRSAEKERTEVAQRALKQERIRQEVLRWANPILNSVRSLDGRLNNVLFEGGHLALGERTQAQVNPNWSISYDYFMPSTIYLFGQYFCWVRLLEERLSFEIFETQLEKDRFYSAIRGVSKALGGFPPAYEGEGRDVQVFALQQRLVGEALIVRDAGAEPRCMSYFDFTRQLQNPDFQNVTQPLRMLLHELRSGERRWKRLSAVLWHLKNLEQVSAHLLDVHLEETGGGPGTSGGPNAQN